MTLQKENGSVQLLTFKLDDQEYALKTVEVVQVTRMVAMVHPPKVSEIIEGMFNLRGKVIPVVNIRKLFGLPAKTYDVNTQLLIAQSDARTLALAVDAVSEVLTLPPSNLESPEQIGIQTEYLSAVGKIGSRLILILNPGTLLRDELARA
jgi:purine-binding chemotaxis protein CheW